MTDLRLCLSKMSRLKLSVIGQSSSHKLEDEKAQGGDKKLRCVLSNATKSSSVLTKAVVPKRVAKRDRDDDSIPERRTSYVRALTFTIPGQGPAWRHKRRQIFTEIFQLWEQEELHEIGGKSSKEIKKARSNSSVSIGNETFINYFFIVVFTLETKSHLSLSWPTPHYMHANANSRDLFLQSFILD